MRAKDNLIFRFRSYQKLNIWINFSAKRVNRIFCLQEKWREQSRKKGTQINWKIKPTKNLGEQMFIIRWKLIPDMGGNAGFDTSWISTLACKSRRRYPGKSRRPVWESPRSSESASPRAAPALLGYWRMGSTLRRSMQKHHLFDRLGKEVRSGTFG